MAVFKTVDEIKEALTSQAPEEFFNNYILGHHAENFSVDKIRFVAEVIANEYGEKINENEILVVGSSKLGFALHNKKKRDNTVLPAFRSFGEASDIDISICSPSLFTAFWHEISAYLSRSRIMPNRQGNLGDYMAHGWLRQDQLPPYVIRHLVKCGSLKKVCGIVRKDRDRGHPMANLGIFYDIEHLKIYQVRSIGICRDQLEKPL